jgi:CheY-like chemotaxis protein
MEAISLSAELRRIPVVMFTTSRRASDMERGLSLGATKFTIKPSSYPELVSFAHELVDVVRG